MSFSIEVLRRWAFQRITPGARVLKWGDVPESMKGTTPKRWLTKTLPEDRCQAALPRCDRKTTRCFFERCSRKAKTAGWCGLHRKGYKRGPNAKPESALT